MVTVYPRDWSSLANEAEIIPLPSDDVTPPVTKIYFEEAIVEFNVWCLVFECLFDFKLQTIKQQTFLLYGKQKYVIFNG